MEIASDCLMTVHTRFNFRFSLLLSQLTHRMPRKLTQILHFINCVKTVS